MDLSSWIERGADFTPAKPALRFEGLIVSYSALDQRIRALAAGLKSTLGIGRGDRLAWLGTNTPDMVAALFACARLGAMFVPLNWRLAPPEHAYILDHCGAKALIADSGLAASAGVTALAGRFARIAAGGAASGWRDLDDVIGSGGGDDRNPHADGQTPLLLVYTSGTTGRPKGAVLTQDALLWNAINSSHMHDLTSADRVLTTAPLFHVGGLNIQTLPALHAGATVTLHRRFDPGGFLATVASERPTLTVLVPAQMLALLDHPSWPGADLSSLRLITTGSTIVPTALIRRFQARGLTVVQVYGATETAPIAIYQRAADAEKVGNTGKPALHCAVRLVDSQGRDVAAGERGEIWVRGGNVMTEYWNDAEATRAAFTDGWYRTGDLGHRDADGYYTIDDRARDVIISGGENIYPAELENILAESADIAEAAVVGRDHPRWGEVPVAVIVAKAGAVGLTRDKLLALFEGRIARFKHPKDVVFVSALPRNVMGKVQKFALAAMIADYGGGQPAERSGQPAEGGEGGSVWAEKRAGEV